MEVLINNRVHKVIVIKKQNKNTYIRVKEDLNIYITTNYMVSNKYIKDLVDDNIISIKKMIDRELKKRHRNKEVYYLGNKYDPIIIKSLKEVNISGDRIFLNNLSSLNKWYLKEAKVVFSNRLNKMVNIFNENLPLVNLRIIKMKTRWGVCNRRTNTVTLNLELLKKKIEIIDYVIIHELAHFIHPNHSKSFWNLVEKYVPNYKELRKKLKQI